MEATTQNLKERWQKLLENSPKLRIRNAAQELGVSEAELLSTQIGEGVTRLRNAPKEILALIKNLGYVMALSRNDEVVHERKGNYPDFQFGPHASLFVSPDIDLRIFLNHWTYCFAVESQGPQKTRKSLQFFGKDGQAIHKIFLQENSNEEAWNEIRQSFKADLQEPILEVEPPTEPKGEMPDAMVDQAAFQEAWLQLKDTHDFYMLLAKHRLSRTQALRLAPSEKYAKQIDNGACRKLLNYIASKEVPIMVFVGNKGMIQIHTGLAKNIVDHGPWLNILDPEFNLHLKESEVAQTWVVRKPTEDGIVTALELYNAKKELICTLFGKRKPGIPELEEWRDAIAFLEE